MEDLTYLEEEILRAANSGDPITAREILVNAEEEVLARKGLRGELYYVPQIKSLFERGLINREQVSLLNDSLDSLELCRLYRPQFA